MPIARGLAVSCVVGCVVTLIGRWFSVDHQAAAYAINGITRSSDYDKWCVLAMWVIAAPLFEEWVLRGMLYRSLRRNWGVALSVISSAVLFATLHPAAGAVPLITLGGTEFPTSMVALSNLASGNYVIYRRVLAGAFMATVPLIVLLLIGGRQIVRGIMEGAVKS